MKALKTIDDHVLAFWYTAPEERVWAYLATFPVLVLIVDLILQAI